MQVMISGQTAQLNQTIIGVDQRLGQRLDAHETRIDGHNKDITDLRSELQALKVEVASKPTRSSSIPPRGALGRDRHRHLEAFLGGLPNLRRNHARRGDHWPARGIGSR